LWDFPPSNSDFFRFPPTLGVARGRVARLPANVPFANGSGEDHETLTNTIKTVGVLEAFRRAGFQLARSQQSKLETYSTENRVGSTPMSGEFDYISWLRGRTPPSPKILVGPGDDCAVLTPNKRPLLVTTDMLMDGTDFIISEVGPRRAGRKAMAANLSDIAAMAGVPTAAVVSLALPRKVTGDRGQATDLEPRFFAEELYLGLRDVADAFDVAIVGGDTNSWAGPLVISVTVLGEATERGAVLRSGARVGDWIFVTGPLGGSILGHHLDFTPRVREALALNAAVDVHAMCDISDGLSADLNHILEESRCGAVLEMDAIPISAAAREISLKSNKTPLQHALGDGEDFELVFTVSPLDGEKLLREPPIAGLVKIGECVESGLWLQVGNDRTKLKPTGWVHEF
jgi:thiamine-monophosphate kinase